MRSLYFFILILCISSQVKAAPFYQGIRQMGMGGAAIAVVNDETSLLINPIGLGRLREPYVTLVDPEITSNMGSLKTLKALTVIDANDLQKLYDELNNQLDKRFYAKTQIFPSYANKNNGIGFLAKNEITATRSSTTNLLDLDYVSDYALVMGINESFGGGIFKIGAIGKIIDRIAYKGNVDPTTQELDIQKIGSEGMGVGVDVGMSLSSPTAWLPTLAVVAKDVGNTSFTLSSGMRNAEGTGDPVAIPMTVDVALAVFPIQTQNMRTTFTVEYSDATNYYTTLSTAQKMHAGAEINLIDQLFFRVGYNRGYLTGGFEWAFRFFQLQLAYYGEEIGTELNPIKDERVSAKFVFRF